MGKITFEFNNKTYSYTNKELAKMIEFYNKMQIDSETTSCPLCSCDFEDNNLFVCKKCNELKEIEEMCLEHNYESDRICKDCCEDCQDEKNYNDYIDSEIDRARGK